MGKIKTRKHGIELGFKVECRVTGFKGTVTSITRYLHGCDRVIVQPTIKEDGSIPEAQVIDEPQVKILSKILDFELEESKPSTSLGDKVIDDLTRFTGIVFGHGYFLNGCVRTGVAPKVTTKNELKSVEWFDDPQLRVIIEKVVKKGDGRTGGPSHSLDTGKSYGKR